MPFGYLEFSRAIGRELCPHMRACARAPPLAATVARRARARVPYPAWFFLNQVSRVWVASIPAPLLEPDPPRYPDPICSSWTANRCNCWVEPLQRFRPNRCNLSLGSDPPLQPFVGFRPVGPSWRAINSAPVSHFKHTNTKSENLFSLYTF